MGASEIVIGLVVLLAAYLLWQILRFLRTGAPGVPATSGRSGSEFDTVAPAALPPQAEFESPALTPAPVAPAERLESDNGELRSLRRQIDLARGEHEALRGEVLRLRTELDQLAAELRAARNVSPQYGEAVGLAQRGLDAQAIAERCGISVAEAELVLALSRAPQTSAES